METNSNSSTLIIIRGLPGSGKSHLARALTKAMPEIVVLDPDAVDMLGVEYLEHSEQLTREHVDPKLFLYRFLRAKAYQAIINHKIFLWNQPFSNREIFDKMMGRLNDCAADNHVELKVLVIEMQINPGRAYERVERRIARGRHGPSLSTFERFKREFNSFDDSYPTLKIRGEGDTRQAVELIKHRLRHLG